MKSTKPSRDAAGRQTAGDRQRHRDAEGQRDGDARDARDEHQASLRAEVGDIHPHADEQHVEHEPDQADTLSRSRLLGGKDPGRGARREPAEQRRPQQQARDHFADDARLADAAHRGADAAGDGDDDDDLDEQREGG